MESQSHRPHWSIPTSPRIWACRPSPTTERHNPTVLFWSIPTAYRNLGCRLSMVPKVAIPPSSSGQFLIGQFPLHGQNVVNWDLVDGSQSHRPRMASSHCTRTSSTTGFILHKSQSPPSSSGQFPRYNASPGPPAACSWYLSQSHRPHLVNSHGSAVYEVFHRWPSSVAIPPSSSGQFPRFKFEGTVVTFNKSQSHRPHLVNSNSRSTCLASGFMTSRRSCNPTILIWSISTGPLGAADRLHGGVTRRNPTVLIWSIHTVTLSDVPVDEIPGVLESQSHRPHLVNSHPHIHGGSLLRVLGTVAIPPTSSGQFAQEGHRADLSAGQYHLAVVAIPPTSSGQFPRGRRRGQLRPECNRRVAIPPTSSGQFPTFNRLRPRRGGTELRVAIPPSSSGQFPRSFPDGHGARLGYRRRVAIPPSSSGQFPPEHVWALVLWS